jgi:hypothetical protein
LTVVHVCEDITDATSSIVASVAGFASKFGACAKFLVESEEEFVKDKTREKDTQGASLCCTIAIGEEIPDAIWSLIPAFCRVTVKQIKDGEMLRKFVKKNSANFLAGNRVKHVALVKKEAYTGGGCRKELVSGARNGTLNLK